MDKVNQFGVIINCISENSSGIKMGSVYHCRETVMSMRSNTLLEERRVTEKFEKQKCKAKNRCIVTSTKTLKSDLPFDWYKESRA